MTQAEELEARAEAFADAVVQLVLALPDTQVARKMGGQLHDAATSVAANYRAARRGRSHAEFTAKLGTVVEEADESIYWLKRMVNAKIRGPVAPEPLLKEADELVRIFAKSHHTARRHRRRRNDDR